MYLKRPQRQKGTPRRDETDESKRAPFLRRGFERYPGFLPARKRAVPLFKRDGPGGDANNFVADNCRVLRCRQLLEETGILSVID